jgi:curved DNA-binding protein CbpA
VHYYNLLEENPKASPDALKAAYKRLSRKLHSDKNCRTHTIEEGKQIGAQDYKVHACVFGGFFLGEIKLFE